MKTFRIFLLLAGAVLFGLALAVALRGPDTAELQSGLLLTQPRPLPAFELLDHNGERFGPERLHGRWHLLFSGFTHCPDLCPNTLGLLAAVERALGDDAAGLQTLFLSVDPQRDTPESLKAYVNYFSPRFVGITGDAAQIETLMRGLGLGYALGDTSQPGYTVDHAATLVLIDPQGRVAAYFSPPHTVEALSADLRRIIGS